MPARSAGDAQPALVPEAAARVSPALCGSPTGADPASADGKASSGQSVNSSPQSLFMAAAFDRISTLAVYFVDSLHLEAFTVY